VYGAPSNVSDRPPSGVSKPAIRCTFRSPMAYGCALPCCPSMSLIRDLSTPIFPSVLINRCTTRSIPSRPFGNRQCVRRTSTALRPGIP